MQIINAIATLYTSECINFIGNWLLLVSFFFQCVLSFRKWHKSVIMWTWIRTMKMCQRSRVKSVKCMKKEVINKLSLKHLIVYNIVSLKLFKTAKL